MAIEDQGNRCEGEGPNPPSGSPSWTVSKHSNTIQRGQKGLGGAGGEQSGETRDEKEETQGKVMCPSCRQPDPLLQGDRQPALTMVQTAQ